MSRSPASRAMMIAGALALAAPGAAQAHLQAFAPGSLIIPMDACHQAAPDQPRPAGCTSGKETPNDGAVRAYGLVHTLLRKGVSVSVAVAPGKTSPDEVDLQVQAPGPDAPVGRLSRATDSVSSFTSELSLSYRGAPFLIDAAAAPRARALLSTDPDLAAYAGTEIHVAAVNFQAEVAVELQGAPARLAIIDPCDGSPGCPRGGTPSSEGIPLMLAYLRRAGLDAGAGLVGTLDSPGAVADVVTRAEIAHRDALRVGHYGLVWLPHYAAPVWSGTAYVLPADDQTVLGRLTDFVASGGVLLGQCAAVFSLEGGNDPAWRRYVPPPSIGGYLFQGGAGGFLNSLLGCYPGNAAGFQAGCSTPIAPIAAPPGRALQHGDPANLLSQTGDFVYFNFHDTPPGANTEWTVGSWDILPTDEWRAEVTHLIRSQDGDPALNAVDMLSLVRPAAGQVVYLGGHTYAEPAAPSTAGMRLVLNTLLFGKPARDLTEQARSGPIVAADGRVYQGTFRPGAGTPARYTRAEDAGRWVFPHTLGHLREYPAARFPAGTREALGARGESWDAATRLAEGAARRVLTHDGSGVSLALIDFDTGQRARFQADLALPVGATGADHDALVQAVRAGRLGGIDHSTLALVPPSGLVPQGATRPTVAYVGALDGQLHAIAVVGGPAPPGTELWSFLPRDQLSRLRENSAGVDGSPNVRDLYDDWDGAGRRSWRTYLAVTEGAYGTLLSVLDVTDPLTPVLRWQRGSDAISNARGATWSLVNRSPSGLMSQLVVATGRPAGGAGVQVAGLSGRDGQTLWTFAAGYTRTLPGGAGALPNDMPGPPAVVDAAARGTEDRIYVADYEGRVFELDAASGINPLGGSTPLYDVGLTPQGNVQPIGAPLALYRDTQTGHLMVLAATGGADWAAPTDTYAVYAIDVEVIDPDTGHRGRQVFRTEVSGRVYAAPTIYGNDVYVLASAGPLGGVLGGTGEGGILHRINLSTHLETMRFDVGKGAGAFQMGEGGTILGATARDLVVLDNAGADRRGTALFDVNLRRLSFRAWLEPL